jgi:rare lipoprotein A (peptidoglycan hydrolase)
MFRPILIGKSCCALVLALGGLSASAEHGSTGLASFYASVPDQSERLTAAHRHLPFGTMVSVTRIDTGAHVVVRINDRGPFIAGRIIDLSHAAAEQLGMMGVGLAPVKIQVIPAPIPAIRTVHDREAVRDRSDEALQ